MLLQINRCLSGIPEDAVAAMGGQSASREPKTAAVRTDAARLVRVGAAIGCFISGYRRDLRTRS